MNKIILAIGVTILFIGMSFNSISGIQIQNNPVIKSYGGNTLYVGGNGSGNYSNIQAAIDNAVDGNTVFVYDDSSPYYENLEVDKSINLIGEGKNTTIIDGNFNRDVIKINSNNTTINSFTIQNSGLDNFYSGINLEYYNNTTISNVNLNNNLNGIFLSKSNNNIIKNNRIFNNSYCGILVYYYCNRNIIDNNTICLNSPYGSGIYFENSNLNTVLNNNIIQNHLGIEIAGSNNNIIKDNIIQENEGRGIDISYSNNTYIENNKFIKNNNRGISLHGSNNIITDNYFFNNTEGILIFSGYNTIKNNTFFYDGLRLWIGSISHLTIFNNTINNKPLIYLESEFDKIIENDAGQIILLNCNLIKIINNTISHVVEGISLFHSQGCLIEGNIICNTYWNGINLYGSFRNKILNNSVYNNMDTGILLEYTVINQISYNNLKNNKFGLYISYSFNNKINCNNFLKNKWNAFFYDSINQWNNNYWDKNRILPNPIFGLMIIKDFEIRWFQFDWHPAKEPYDI